MTAEFLNPVLLHVPNVQRQTIKSGANNEFAVMFYKELLKQGLSQGFMGENDGPYMNVAREVFIESLAKEFAEKNSAFMPVLERKEEGIVNN